MDPVSLPLPPHGPKPERIVRPRPAASLVLVQETMDGPAVLMGVRSGGHRFMPNRLVFPGGRLERADHAIRFARPCPDSVRIAFGRSAAALAAAAIRETFEETGLRLAAPAMPGERVPRRGAWAPFCAGGLLPDPSGLVPLCRLITPTFMPIRFDARFFAAPADRASGALAGNGELDPLRWIPLEEAQSLDLAMPQRVVLAELAAWRASGGGDRPAAPLWREIGTRLVRSPPR